MSDGLIFYILDSETTGLSAQYHDVIELSLIRCYDKLQINRTIKATNPKAASVDALRITGKTEADLYHGISRQQAVSDINNFLNLDGATPEHRCIVAHNGINFDKKMIHAMWEKENQLFPASLWVDTIHLVREYAKKSGIIKPKTNLTASLEMLKIANTQQMHTATGDARATYYLWMRLINEIDYLRHIKRFPHLDKNLEEDILDLE